MAIFAITDGRYGRPESVVWTTPTLINTLLRCINRSIQKIVTHSTRDLIDSLVASLGWIISSANSALAAQAHTHALIVAKAELHGKSESATVNHAADCLPVGASQQCNNLHGRLVKADCYDLRWTTMIPPEIWRTLRRQR